jgi:hypothetical protein
MKLPFMPWIDYLPEVGAPIRKDRDRLAGKLAEAAKLEQQAEGLRAEVFKARAALVVRVAEQWSPQDMAAARAQAGAAASVLSPEYVADPALRAALTTLDGHGSALVLLRVFKAQAFRQHNLLSTASDEERRATLERILDWWNFGAVPLLEGVAP